MRGAGGSRAIEEAQQQVLLGPFYFRILQRVGDNRFLESWGPSKSGFCFCLDNGCGCDPLSKHPLKEGLRLASRCVMCGCEKETVCPPFTPLR